MVRCQDKASPTTLSKALAQLISKQKIVSFGHSPFQIPTKVLSNLELRSE